MMHWSADHGSEDIASLTSLFESAKIFTVHIIYATSLWSFGGLGREGTEIFPTLLFTCNAGMMLTGTPPPPLL